MILAYGDPHGRWTPLLDAAERLRPSAVVLLGDMDLTAPLRRTVAPLLDVGIGVHWIPGNHDVGSADAYRWLWKDHPDGSLHGRVVEIGGLRVAGLGGHFKGKIWYPQRGGEKPIHRSRADWMRENQARMDDGVPLHLRAAVWPEDVAELAGRRADVLVTHEAPTSHRAGFRGIDDLARTMRVRLVIHGHHHYSYTSEIEGGIRVRGLGMAETWVIDEVRP